MATANREVIVVEKVVKEDHDGVVLRLSIEEAEALQAVLGSVGGNPRNTAREEIDATYRALHEAGVHGSLPEDQRLVGALYFEVRKFVF